MLSRRHLRIKVLQALYAFTVSSNDRLDLGEKELLRSLDKLYEIYIYQLSLIIEIVNFARKRLEENKLKATAFCSSKLTQHIRKVKKSHTL